ncbi:MAG: hypothetical protein U0136_17070 [Bdellovibrionota bacterium]
MKYMILVIALFLICPSRALGAVGCTLSNPAEDLKYLYPEMTNYKEELKNYETLADGRKLYDDLKERLGSDLDPVYETFETPYTIYQIFKGETLIGLVHGVNVPGKGGVIQVFLALDPSTAEIRNFFYQRLESRIAGDLRRKAFRQQFSGLTLADFYKHEFYRVADPGSKLDKLAGIKLAENGAPSSEDAVFDYQASIRGIRKNLILVDQFWFKHRFEPFFERARQALKDKSTER